LAGGCTSGHGISGALQLSVGSWVALACFFLGGVPVAMLLYRV
ncbi:MAG: YeeE/YedE thiosulfate transporter family protein, partial [Azospirillaceae bacterium]